MKKLRVMTVIGARPQFIKAAAVSRIFQTSEILDEYILHTGQHYDANMSDVFFEEMRIPCPKYNLEIGSGSHGAQTGAMLVAVEKVLIDCRPDVVLVYGDTNSTLAGALAAAKMNIPIAHVEAGLRSFNREMPEEVNRVLTDHLSRWLFAPSKSAVSNLRREGLREESILEVGDVMYDACLFFGRDVTWGTAIMDSLKIDPQCYVLATIHRAENTNNIERLLIILQALSSLADQKRVVLPLHPRTRSVLKDRESTRKLLDKIQVIEPVGYKDMLVLEKNACLIATDSGGVQKEAFFFRVPCVTLREETEWLETVELGWNQVVPPTSPEALIAAFVRAGSCSRLDEYPYGRGDAATKILSTLHNYAQSNF